MNLMATNSNSLVNKALNHIGHTQKYVSRLEGIEYQTVSVSHFLIQRGT